MKDAPAQAGGARRRVDWRLAAQLRAEGVGINQIAERLGCAASTVRRRLKTGQGLREQAAEYVPQVLPDHLRLEALRHQLHQAIESEVRQGNVRVILWLADRMKLIEPSRSTAPEDELGRLISGMSPDELSEFEGLRDRE